MSDFKLIHGDCLNVMKDIPDGSVDAVITDPPYGIKIVQSRGEIKGHYRTARRKYWKVIANDDKIFNPAFLLKYPTIVLWGANWYADQLPPGRWLIWDKQHGGGNAGDHSEAEVAWTNKGKAIKFFRHMWLGVRRDSEVGEKVKHPTQKPVELMKWCIELVTNPGDTILDPFLGSGTTALVAHNLGRTGIGTDLSFEYLKLAKDRLGITALEEWESGKQAEANLEDLPMFQEATQ